MLALLNNMCNCCSEKGNVCYFFLLSRQIAGYAFKIDFSPDGRYDSNDCTFKCTCMKVDYLSTIILLTVCLL